MAFFTALCGIGAWVFVETRADATVAGNGRGDCLAGNAASRSRNPSELSGVISAGGDVRAERYILVEGADRLPRPGITADCGDVTNWGGSIEIEADSGSDAASEPGR